MKKTFMCNLLTMAILAVVGFVTTSCGDDDDDNNNGGGGGSNNLVGYWVKEAHLNNPTINGSGGVVTSFAYQFFADGTVYEFQVQHTGLGARYSYAEANTSWEKLTIRDGISFYINPDKRLKRYTLADDIIVIDIDSEEPIVMEIKSPNRIEAISSDGWAEGTYVKVGTQTLGYTNDDSGNGSGGSSGGGVDTEVYIINDYEMLKGVENLGNGWYSYLLQFGFGANSDDAYRKGMTQIKLTAWADNGSFDFNYKTSNYGKKNTYTLYLSPSEKDWYGMIPIQSKDNKITFNYKLEYYNSVDGKWYEIQSRTLTFNNGNSGNSSGGNSGNSGNSGDNSGGGNNSGGNSGGGSSSGGSGSSGSGSGSSGTATSKSIDYYVGTKRFKTVLVEGGSMPAFYIMQTELPIHSNITVGGKNIGYVDYNGDGVIIKSELSSFLQNLRNATNIQFRLPTKEEWQYAARGGNKSRGYTYSGSNNVSDVAWYKDNSSSKVHDVATKQANELGLYDMSGNYAEVCAKEGSDEFNIDGDICGGSWQDAASDCTVTSWVKGSVVGKISGTGVAEVNAVNGKYVTIRLVYTKQ